MHLQPMAVGLEPCPDLGVLVVRGVILNQDRPLAAVSPGQLFQETEVRGGIEDGVLAIVESRVPKFDGAENLHALAFSRDGDLWWTTHSAPGGVQRRVLPEASLVGEDQ